MARVSELFQFRIADFCELHCLFSPWINSSGGVDRLELIILSASVPMVLSLLVRKISCPDDGNFAMRNQDAHSTAKNGGLRNRIMEAMIDAFSQVYRLLENDDIEVED